MRILHVTDSYLPKLGGIELHVRDLAARQRAAGHHVEIATAAPYDGPEVDVRRVAGGPRSWLDDAAPDVVQAHVSIISPFALATARRASFERLPTAVTVHSLWTRIGPLPEVVRDVWGMRRWPVTWSAVSVRAARPVGDLLGLPVHVVPNAVDLDRWQPFDALPSADPPHVVSVMRLTKIKRSLPLVRILSRAAREADFTATIVGDGPERDSVERCLRSWGLADRVRLAGTLDRCAIRSLLEDASVFVAPAHRESFGIAALEARASGVPVVASGRSGVPTFVEHGRDGLLARDDREMAAHLVTLLRDRPLREGIAWHNRLVAPTYGWEQALARNEALYATARSAVFARPARARLLEGVAG